MEQLKKNIREPFIFVLLVVVIFVLDAVIPISFNQFGIHPRSFFGLFGIVFSPFLHGDLHHLLSNLPPLLILSILLRTSGKQAFIVVTCLLILISGILTWLLSSAGIVIGASGLVFAYWSYLVTTGVRLKTFQTILIAIATLFFYGGIILSLASFETGISWAGHFSGLIAGILLAFFLPPPSRNIVK